MTDATKIVALLSTDNPTPEIELNYSNPLELLIATILSAQCTDKRVNIVTKTLFKRYQSVDEFAVADLAILEGEIRSTGFFRNKAKSIVNCCKKLIENFNGQVPSTMDELISLPGVGRKTANCVMVGAFEKEAIAVDTHVVRLSNRLGLVKSKNPDEIEQILMKKVPENRWSFFNLAIILHGRRVCFARKPNCADCILNEECEWPEKRTS